MCGICKKLSEWRPGVNGPDDHEWRETSSSCCQLLVAGKWWGEWKIFAVVPASFILDGERCEQLVASAISIDQVREEVKANADVVRYSLKISRLGRHGLAVPAMVAYRHYFENINTSTDDPNWRCWAGKCSAPADCPHTYMSDIAVLRVEEIPRNCQTSLNCRAIKFDSVVDFNMRHIREMIKEEKDVYIQVGGGAYGGCEIQGRLVDGGRPGRGQDSLTRTYADHVSFFIDVREQSRLVEKGMVLYVNDTRRGQEKRHAFAMIIGQNPIPDETIYQAVLLKKGLKDIEIDYSRLVSDFRNSKDPPCSFLLPGRR